MGVDLLLERVLEKQLVQSPFTGAVGDVSFGIATQVCMSIEVVIISREP